MTDSATPTSRTRVPRITHRRQASPLMKVSMVLFAIGLIAVTADVAMFASGVTDLPLWVNLAALLAPIGFGIGLLAVFLEARSRPKPPA